LINFVDCNIKHFEGTICEVSLYKQRYGVAGSLSITLVVMALTRNGLLGLGLIQQSALQSLIDERCLVYIADR